jgi:hypothetical protein
LFVPQSSAATGTQAGIRHLRLNIFTELALSAAVLLVVVSLGQFDP